MFLQAPRVAPSPTPGQQADPNPAPLPANTPGLSGMAGIAGRVR
jgi:hypothetical protein